MINGSSQTPLGQRVMNAMNVIRFLFRYSDE